MKDLVLEGTIFEIGSGDPEHEQGRPQIKIGVPVENEDEDEPDDEDEDSYVEYKSIIINTDADTAKLFAPHLFDNVRISITISPSSDVIRH